ncbi:MAG: flavin-containing monooxygenase, partial [Brachybacterium sp.]
GSSSSAVEQFRRLRAGAESAVPVTHPRAGSGLLGRLGSVVGANRVTIRSAASTHETGEKLVPAADRDTLLARLRSVRGLFA